MAIMEILNLKKDVEKKEIVFSYLDENQDLKIGKVVIKPTEDIEEIFSELNLKFFKLNDEMKRLKRRNNAKLRRLKKEITEEEKAKKEEQLKISRSNRNCVDYVLKIRSTGAIIMQSELLEILKKDHPKLTKSHIQYIATFKKSLYGEFYDVIGEKRFIKNTITGKIKEEKWKLNYKLF